MQRIYGLLLLCVWAFSALANPLNPHKPTGDGTFTSPYYIRSLENFEWLYYYRNNFETNSTIYCRQYNDIDASSAKDFVYDEAIRGKGFPSVFAENYTLVYDGNGYSILNPYMSDSNYSTNYLGIFAKGSFKVNNLKIEGAVVTSARDCENHIGILIGHASGTVDVWNCEISGEIALDNQKISYVGGAIGYADKAKLTVDSCFCESQLQVVSDKKRVDIGSFLGYSRRSVININKTNLKGRVSARCPVNGYIGGFISELDSSQTNIKSVKVDVAIEVEEAARVAGFLACTDGSYEGVCYITDCKVKGSIQGEKIETLGGFIARTNGKTSVSITDSGSTSDITVGNVYNFGGFASLLTAKEKCDFNDCYYEGEASAEHLEYEAGGFVGVIAPESYVVFNDCHASGSFEFGRNEVFDVYLGGFAGTVSVDSGQTLQFSRCFASTDFKAEKANYFGGFLGCVDNFGAVEIKESCAQIELEDASSSEKNLALGGFLGFVRTESGDGCSFAVKDCYTLFDVTWKNAGYVGGFLGDEMLGSKTTIVNCYSAGSVNLETSDALSGFIGEQSVNNLVVEDSYFLLDLLPKGTKDSFASGLKYKEMTLQSSFKNWDFDNVWQISKTTPYLRFVPIEKTYPEVVMKYKGTGSCEWEKGVITITGGSPKDSLVVTPVKGFVCAVKKVVSNSGLKKLSVAGDLEELDIKGALGTLTVKGGDLGIKQEDDVYTLVFNGEKTKINVKAVKDKETKKLVGGNISGNLLCGTLNQDGQIESLGNVQKLSVVGGDLVDGKLRANSLQKLILKAKAKTGGHQINFEVVVN